MRKPNFLVIVADDMGFSDAGCYGGEISTPNLDALAADGVRFEYSFTCQPVCGPARACLQTGKYATETGCFVNGIALPRDETTLAHLLSGESGCLAVISL